MELQLKYEGKKPAQHKKRSRGNTKSVKKAMVSKNQENSAYLEIAHNIRGACQANEKEGY